MKVTRIDAHHVVLPLVQPYKLSSRYGTVTEAHAVVVELHTDEGLVGLGEANPMPPFTQESWGSVFAAIRGYLGPGLLGRDPTDLLAVNATFDAVLSGNLLAKGALDVAMWDLLGKALGVPVHKILGGALRDSVPLLWPLGSGTAEQDLHRIRRKMHEGYRTFMIKMGALPIATEVERVKAIESTFGGRIRVNVDANQGWDLPGTLSFMDATGDCSLDFVEQPVPRNQAWALTPIRSRATHPISADEGVQSLDDATMLASRHLVDVFSLKISKNGGILRSRNIALIAQAFGLKCLVNSMIELGISQAAGLQLAATIPNLLDCGHCFMSTLRLKGDVTDFADFIQEAVVHLPPGPGLGIALDRERLEHYSRASISLGP